MRTKTISVTVPTIPPEFYLKISFLSKRTSHLFSGLSHKTAHVFNSLTSMIQDRKSNSMFSQSKSTDLAGKTPRDKRNNILKVISLGIVVIVIIFAATQVLSRWGKPTNSAVLSTEVKPAIASVKVDKEYSFPLNSKGVKVADIKYLIESAELRDEILVKGQRATAVKGRIFLILTIKITNDYKSSIQMDSRNYVRLSVNGNENEWLAPDIHNDPVEVQAISTKYTRVGFAINDSDKNLVLSVGEIDGQKDKVPLEFK